MSKKNIITLNGKQYDAATGKLLATPAKTVAVATKAVAHPAVKRQPVKHANAHTPTPARTLMRQAVKKPAPSHRHPVKAQGHLDTAAKRPVNTVAAKPSVKRVNTQRLREARRVSQSQLVSRFSPELFTNPWPTTAVGTTVNLALSARARQAAPLQNPKRSAGKPKTTAELLDYAISQATSHQQPPHELPRRGLFKRRARPATV